VIEHIPAFSSLNPVGAALAARTQNKSSLHWTGNLSITYGRCDIPTLESFELNARYLYPEKQILIEALEQWIWAEGWRNRTCDNPKCLGCL
jgi:hypothetical protein